jgi:hypothetical protein
MQIHRSTVQRHPSHSAKCHPSSSASQYICAASGNTQSSDQKKSIHACTISQHYGVYAANDMNYCIIPNKRLLACAAL